MRVSPESVAEIDYRPEHGKLFVTFRDGGEFVFVGVPERIGRAFARSASKGRFFQRIIRDHYPYNRV